MAWGQLERGFEVVAVGDMCFERMEAVQTGFGGDGTWCIQGMGAVQKAV